MACSIWAGAAPLGRLLAGLPFAWAAMPHTAGCLPRQTGPRAHVHCRAGGLLVPHGREACAGALALPGRAAIAEIYSSHRGINTTSHNSIILCIFFDELR